MKVLTAVDLQTALDTDLVWRRREISTLVTLMKTAPGASQAVLIRSAVPLLYAHWEGFGKICILRYLEHVSYRAIRFRDLKPAFAYLQMIGEIREVSRSSPLSAITLLKATLGRWDDKNRNPFKKQVSTKSNLRFDVLQEMLAVCAIEANEFASYKDFINKDLCDARNEIAHGAGGAPPLSVFITRRDRAFQLMTELHIVVVNAAANEEFRA